MTPQVLEALQKLSIRKKQTVRIETKYSDELLEYLNKHCPKSKINYLSFGRGVYFLERQSAANTIILPQDQTK